MNMEAQTREPQMGLTFEKVWASLMELREESRDTDRRLKDTDRLIRELRESQQETDRLVKETDRLVKETSKSLGGRNNSFGELAEHLVAPNIKEKFNALGYHFKGIAENQRIANEQGQIIAEIDILLENSNYIVAVEVKSKPKNADIDNFVKRLGVLRQYKDENNDKRKIRGAIAGAVFHDAVKRVTLEAGFYVIEQTGDTVKISVPEEFKPKEW
jgi:RecB family endonuclease NucS